MILFLLTVSFNRCEGNMFTFLFKFFFFEEEETQNVDGVLFK
jgi:hypothetical protein